MIDPWAPKHEVRVGFGPLTESMRRMTHCFDLTFTTPSCSREFSGCAPNATDHVSEFQRRLTTDPAAI